MFKQFLVSICFLCISFNTMADPIPNGDKEPKKYQFQSAQIKRHLLDKKLKRSQSHFRSQVFQLSGEAEQTNCDDVDNYLRRDVFADLFEHDFYFSGMLICFDMSDKVQYTFEGFFEPIDDDAAAVGNRMLAELEGKEIYGSTLHFYTVKAIIYNLLMTVGHRNAEDERDDLFYDVHSTSSIRVNSLGEAFDTVFDEIDQNFEPTNIALFIPMVSKLFGDEAGAMIEDALYKGNSVRMVAIPMFLYGNNISIHRDAVGTYFADEFCDEANQKSCL